MRAIALMFSSASAWNTTISSMRLMNSGRNWVFTSAMTAALMAVYSAPTIDWMSCEPRLEVITSTVFLKSTVRPWPSVSRPSSSTWSSALNTSGWAFSTSSNRITE